MNIQTRLLEHLQQLVAFYPATHEPENVRAALDYCYELLAASGSFSDARIIINGSVPSLIASTQGTKTPKLLLQGHIDVVPAAPADRICRLAGDTLTGRGVYDMLFATASYLTLIEELKIRLPLLDLGIMLTGDEETGGYNGVRPLVADGYIPDVCLLPDGGEGFGNLCIGAKGIYSFDLIVHGVAHHASRPWEGDGAGNKAVQLATELINSFDMSDRANSTVAVTRLGGGDAHNKGPHEANLHIDIRYRDRADYRRIVGRLNELCRRFNAEVTNLVNEPDFDVDPAQPAVAAFLQLYEQHASRPIEFTRMPGSSDGRYFAEVGVPVITLWPDGRGAHSDNETVSLRSIMKFYELLKEYTLQTATIKETNE